MVITLIGYRGCGKSSIAPRLARRLGWNWIDSDCVIEERAECSIRQIFETEGEAGFRKRESEVLAELLQRDRIVLASGGGAILSEENRTRMKAAGPVVWLHASVEALTKRLSHNRAGENRPSLTGRPIAEEVAEVMAVREPLYRECATIIVDAEREWPDQVARRIARQISQPPSEHATGENTSELL
ncbi:MAG TPA: shikimate kinase AroL [Planctomycetaceae bacterium]|nr:shikimate kinase AroL [Planctomycetaceae bacterium]